MPDDALRELERRWRQTGAVEDEARWLLARVRAGELSVERLSLAAMLGHAAARATGLAVEVPGGGVLTLELPVNAFVGLAKHALSPLTEREEVDIGCEAVERVLPIWHQHDPEDTAPDRALREARAWLSGRATPESLAAAAAAAEASRQEVFGPPGQVAEAAAWLARLLPFHLTTPRPGAMRFPVVAWSPRSSIPFALLCASVACPTETAWQSARIVSQLLRGRGHGQGTDGHGT